MQANSPIIRLIRITMTLVGLFMMCSFFVLVAMSDIIALEYSNDKAVQEKLHFVLIVIAIIDAFISVFAVVGAYYQNNLLVIVTAVCNSFNTFFTFGISSSYGVLVILWTMTAVNILLTLSSYLYIFLMCYTIPLSEERLSRRTVIAERFDGQSAPNMETQNKVIASPPPYEPPPPYCSTSYLNDS